MTADIAAEYDVREWRDAYLCRQEQATTDHAWCSCSLCPRCTANFLAVDAASIRLDLAVAVRHQPTVDPVDAINRPRVVQETVAW